MTRTLAILAFSTLALAACGNEQETAEPAQKPTENQLTTPAPNATGTPAGSPNNQPANPQGGSGQASQ